MNAQIKKTNKQTFSLCACDQHPYISNTCYQSGIKGMHITGITKASCSHSMMKTQTILLIVICGFMLAAGNGLEKSLNEFSKKPQSEIDALKTVNCHSGSATQKHQLEE